MNQVRASAGFWDVCSSGFSTSQAVMMFKWDNKYKNTVWYIKWPADCGGDSGVNKILWSGDFPGGPVVRLHIPSAGGPSLVPGQEAINRSHMPQLRVHN